MEKTILDILNKCKSEIINKYYGREKYALKHTDFLLLSEEIFQKSGISLSLSTLRRIFSGNYNKLPKISTLNAFALYLGHENWKEYCKSNFNGRNHISLGQQRKRNIIIGSIIAISIIAIGTKFFPNILENFSKTDYSEVEFYSYDYDSTQIPSTITFFYNFKGLKFDTAKLYPLGQFKSGIDDIIQLNPDDSIVTYPYLYPQTFYPKLVIDGKLVKTRKIVFITNEWSSAASRIKPTFIKFFNDTEIFHGGEMALTENILAKEHYQIKDIQKISYHLFKTFNNINGDSVCFETRIKNNIHIRGMESKHVDIDLFLNKRHIHIPFISENTSYNNLSLQIFDSKHSTNRESLSFLYQSFEEWTKIKCKTDKKHFELFINDSLVFKTTHNTNPGKLRGIRYIFTGLGEVDYVRFYNLKNKLIYNDEFD